ncbi:RNase adapter RapZ [Peptostreptococcus porci]|uniref:RNase adapter RapZ n=1 Tax=Peptostreptococcus porci TaxID=2652282 RepID=UPI0023F28FB5|nr:RNase adapter RapZ [Peptostreptococcus porci]MDD7182320.1 RNase adapter RapZ [Peptostreptococcus porci]MDY2794804.1 RNase adapter RapZ [Peptostreptococcus porci]MDY4129222.1 RNase adapter RapZ [Peptostreptococcus porci]MDY4561038.1 RNase adapter RapZ [Peptostreptococcus porci]MDY5437373.1 RNase adapter RapZ [Peptostreptococcus porci]
MKFVIVTGLSGSGKSEAMRALEDMGYYCVDNLPPALIVNFAELFFHSNSNIDKVALGIDIRGREFFQELNSALEHLDSANFKFDMIYLDCDDDVLVKRYKMTRRNHPLAANSQISDGIKKERVIMEPLKKYSRMIIDTSNMKPKDLKQEIASIYDEDDGLNSPNITISVVSFGFKYGLPIDADLVFDVRFLPNPYYDLDLRPKTGDSEDVRAFVMNSEVSKTFVEKLFDLYDFLIPQYINEGKQHLVIGIGCTGGRHRSVTIANYSFDYLNGKGYRVVKKHRDAKLD